MPTKLHINLKQGIIEVDGEPEFVEKVYDDFRSEILKRLSAASAEDEDGAAEPPATGGNPNGTSRETGVGKRKMPKRKGGPSCGSRIMELKTAGTFAKGLSAEEVRLKLEEAGHPYDINLVTATLTNVKNRGDLRRTKRDNKWVYLNP